MGVKEKLFYFKKKLDFEKSGKELKALPEKSTNSETEVDKQLTGNYLHENNEERVINYINNGDVNCVTKTPNLNKGSGCGFMSYYNFYLCIAFI